VVDRRDLVPHAEIATSSSGVKSECYQLTVSGSHRPIVKPADEEGDDALQMPTDPQAMKWNDSVQVNAVN
jgi:hypothetical protein